MKVVGLIRVSTKEQKEKGHGLDIQKRTIEEFCKKNQHEIVHFINEKNVSGDIHLGYSLEEKRPTLVKGLKKAKEMGASAVVVYKTDRLWRGYRSVVYVQDLLYELGLDVISINEPTYKLTDEIAPEVEFVQTLTDATAVLNKKIAVSRMRAGIKEKIRKGDKCLGFAAFGYRYDSNKQIEIDPIEEPIVKMIKQMFDSGMSYRKICDTLTNKGIKTRKGKDWTTGSLHSMINNPFYKGMLKLDDQLVKGNHQPYWT